MKVCIVGGGISGLASAFYLSKVLPSSQIALLEGSKRYGGWVNSAYTPKGNLFEAGPRTLRIVGGLETLSLIKSLNIEDRLLSVDSSEPSAKNRYILDSDGKLVRMPSTVQEYLKHTSGLLSGTLVPLVTEFAKRKGNLDDESIHSFMNRRFGPKIAHVMSAIVHGIYAGDYTKLSMKSCFPSVWNLEKDHGSITRAMFAPQKPPPQLLPSNADSQHYMEIYRKMSGKSLYSFRNGIGTITDAIYTHLQSCQNVRIKLDTQCTAIKDSIVTFKSSSSSSVQEEEFDYIISTLPTYILSPLVKERYPQLSAKLEQIQYGSVAVVNLAYDQPLDIKGFGYLVPQEANNIILGVVFDSCAVPNQQSTSSTRLTVMIKVLDNDSPESFYLNSAIQEVEKRLFLVDPTDTAVHISENCIPQYQVGHGETVKSMESELPKWLILSGSGLRGVSLNDCISNAKRIAMSIAHNDKIN